MSQYRTMMLELAKQRREEHRRKQLPPRNPPPEEVLERIERIRAELEAKGKK